MLADFPFILYWWLIFLFLGLINLPLTFSIFSSFFDKGYTFSKTLTVLLVSYALFFLGAFKILPFLPETVFITIIFFLSLNVYLLKKISWGQLFSFSFLRVVIFEEILFFAGLWFWSFVRAHEPSIHGLEKFMDFGFINSALRGHFFPPLDIWLAKSPDYTGGFTINYYYFGHITGAVLTKLAGIPSSITYNLLLSSLFAQTLVNSFSIGFNLLYAFLSSTIRGVPPLAAGHLEGVLGLHITQNGDKKDSRSKHLGGDRPRSSEVKMFNLPSRKILTFALLAGIVTSFLVTLGGNLHPIYVFTKGYDVENPVPPWQILGKTNSVAYWYPNATRFIPNTIHEFPIYSWVVADIHGHVWDIPFVLLTIALLFALISKSEFLPRSALPTGGWQAALFSKQFRNSNVPNSKQKRFGKLGFGILNLFRMSSFEFRILLLGLFTAVAYMTNAWDGIIYLGLTALVFFYLFVLSPPSNLKDQENQKLNIKYKKNILNIKKIILNSPIFHFLFSIFLLGLAFLMFSLPFSLNFKPFVHSIGVVGGWEIAQALGLIRQTAESVVKLGPFLLEKGNNLRSPWWQLLILWGFFYFNALAFFVFLILPKIKEAKKKFRKFEFRILSRVEMFLILLILLSTMLLIFPEFFYAKDIYPGHYRANTMFKLGYQAFIMLSIVSGFTIVRLIIKRKYEIKRKTIKSHRKDFILNTLYLLLLFPQLFLVAIYPYFSIRSYYGNLKIYKSLDGLKWLSEKYPDDYNAVLYLQEEISGQPVIAEAVGESYTDYARISANTGLVTILGWPVHEWLWRGSYDEAGKRIPEVQTVYESEDIEMIKSILKKYNVAYIFLGSLEREKYKNLAQEKFDSLGKVIFESGETKIYQVY